MKGNHHDRMQHDMLKTYATVFVFLAVITHQANSA